MKSAILGSGPAGMFAAHAMAQLGVEVTIISNSLQKSVLQGAQYLHKNIPGITSAEPDDTVRYKKVGSAEAYSRKVYGYVRPDVSWDLYPDGHHPAWDLRKAYRTAWDMYDDLIKVDTVNPDTVRALSMRYDVIINTVPLPSLCKEGDLGFDWQDVWIQTWQVSDVLPNTVFYNASREVSYYRVSELFGWSAMEFSKQTVNAARVRKPLGFKESLVSHLPSNWMLVGRYGAWDKRALTHDAYYKVTQAFQGAGELL